ncbi:MAG: aminopeptidase [Bacteroidetes bacterium]|nr:MAG: aminopeptidase [Bacteroidota bacterium]PTM11246.1 MAG: aminopeptidase [Bacteroidota bacterium]
MQRTCHFFLLLALINLSNCTKPVETVKLEPGVSNALATYRKEQISKVVYALFFDLPASKEAPVKATLSLRFDLKETAQAVQLDFRATPDQLQQVVVNGESVAIDFREDHLILPPKQLLAGANLVEISFVAGDLSLNRKDDFLYTLLVPDRAATLFPCFDQPNLKAEFILSLQLPADWLALANGSVDTVQIVGDRKVIQFSPTAPISTYLFAFTAGKFQETEATIGGRTMHMLYRESDQEKVALNQAAIFQLHHAALEWMVNYTAIPLPFEKLDFALLPEFQYGGMEHVGAIFYRESSLMLDENATENQKIRRASLIAHETAHMWFGDLVTMSWFDDVWLKEVFANFMAAKIVNPAFPAINHDLNFMMSHQPAAYGEDRSRGSHPIQQPLENLRDAGSLYGRIIYQKAPVVMHQLETMMGPVAFRDGLRAYLNHFAYGNASWDDLVAILDARTDHDLRSWSNVWVKQPGMPIFAVRIAATDTTGLNFIYEQPGQPGSYWSEETAVVLFYPDTIKAISLQLAATPLAGTLSVASEPLAILSHASPMSYGYFPLDRKSQIYFLRNVATISDPLLRGGVWLSLYEDVLRQQLPVGDYFLALLDAIPQEADVINRDYLLASLETIFWQFFTPSERNQYGAAVEQMLAKAYQTAPRPGDQLAYFRTYYHLSTTAPAVVALREIWENNRILSNLPLTEVEAIDLLGELAIRIPAEAPALVKTQMARTLNPDRRARLAFLTPVLAGDEQQRDTFFASLKLLDNRGTEPWVVAAVGYLHHPLRAGQSIRYLPESLALLEEIQATGDIFFPRQFITAILHGHQSAKAAGIVEDFLAARPNYPYRLKNKILMSADLLLRTAYPE